MPCSEFRNKWMVRMSLKAVRDKFIELSGRFDLVNEDGTDSGGNWFINKAQRFLDRHHYNQKSEARVFRKIESGDYGIIFTDCRSITSVWIADEESRIELEKRTDQWFRENYTVKPFTSIDTGTPVCYTQGLFRIHPSMEALAGEDMAIIMGYLDIPMTEQFLYNGIIFAPPANNDFMIEVIGHFYSPKLVNDNDESFWTTNHEEVLIKATLYQLEGFYRNSEGLKDATAFVTSDLMELDKDTVEQEMAGVNSEMGD